MNETRHFPEEEIQKLHDLLKEELPKDELLRRIGAALRQSGMGFSETPTDEKIWASEDIKVGRLAYERGHTHLREAVGSPVELGALLTEVLFRALQRHPKSGKLVECAPQEFAILIGREVPLSFGEWLKETAAWPEVGVDLDELRQGELYKKGSGVLLSAVERKRVDFVKPKGKEFAPCTDPQRALSFVCDVFNTNHWAKTNIPKHERLAYACLILEDLITKGFPVQFTKDDLLKYNIKMGLVVDLKEKRDDRDPPPLPPERDAFLASMLKELRDDKEALKRSREEKAERLKLHLKERLTETSPEQRDLVLEDEAVREALRLLDKKAVVDEGGSVRLEDRRGVPDLKELPEDPVKALGMLSDSLGQMPRDEAIQIAQRYLDHLAERFPLPGRGRRTSPPPYPFDSGEHVAEFSRALECLACRFRWSYALGDQPVSFSARSSGALEVRQRGARKPAGEGHGIPSLVIA